MPEAGESPPHSNRKGYLNMRFATIASGSSGNCTYIGTDHTHLLVDAGIPCKRIIEGLHSLELDEKDLDAILITHEHTDHINGLRVFSKKTEVPIYGTAATIEEICRMDKKGEIDRQRFRIIHPDEMFPVGDFSVFPFAISHDAADPVAYRAEAEGHAAAVVTDLGTFTDYTLSHLMGLDAVVAEANHDIRMLEVGRYPYYLKQRILSDRGHLSNESAGQLLSEVLHDNMKHIILGHLSQENNYPSLAYETVCSEITMSPTPYKGGDFDIQTALRDKAGDIYEW